MARVLRPDAHGAREAVKEDESEIQNPTPPRYYDAPCRCDTRRGLCGCDENGDAAHSYHELHEWTEQAPLRAHRVRYSMPVPYAGQRT